MNLFSWDMNVEKYADPSINTMIRKLQPNGVINHRGMDEGDYGTPERERDENGHAVAFDTPVEVADKAIELGSVKVNGSAVQEVSGTIKSLDVKAWSPKSPNLYELEALLFDKDDLVDDMMDRIGFREIKVLGKKILLNGKPVRLRGYNEGLCQASPYFVWKETANNGAIR